MRSNFHSLVVIRTIIHYEMTQSKMEVYYKGYQWCYFPFTVYIQHLNFLVCNTFENEY